MHEQLKIKEWTDTAIEERALQKYIFFKTAVLQSIKLIDDQNLWKILVKNSF